MSTVASPITSFTIVYSTVNSGKGERDQSSASLAFVRGIHWWPANSPHKGPVTRKMFPFDDIIMWRICITGLQGIYSCLLAVSQLTWRCLCNIIPNTDGHPSLPVLALGQRHHGGCRSADARPSVTVMPTLQLSNIIRVAWYTFIALHNRYKKCWRDVGRSTTRQFLYCWPARLFTVMMPIVSNAHHLAMPLWCL